MELVSHDICEVNFQCLGPGRLIEIPTYWSVNLSALVSFVLWHIEESPALKQPWGGKPVCHLYCFSLGVITLGRMWDAVPFRKVPGGMGPLFSPSGMSVTIWSQLHSTAVGKAGRRAGKTKLVLSLRGRKIASERLMSSGRSTQAQHLDSHKGACKSVRAVLLQSLGLWWVWSAMGLRFSSLCFRRPFGITAGWEPVSARDQQSDSCRPCTPIRVLSSGGGWLKLKGQARTS